MECMSTTKPFRLLRREEKVGVRKSHANNNIGSGHHVAAKKRHGSSQLLSKTFEGISSYGAGREVENEVGEDVEVVDEDYKVELAGNNMLPSSMKESEDDCVDSRESDCGQSDDSDAGNKRVVPIATSL
ncbi:unnamed protein product [Arabis nemorensis]|uniref:Uncharacterized protein n=1 Tax=Arabis nemorensis TaxID=586526 RepID=A0A565C9Z8_9BRAS|nr:unnamed protein product [Arabis nemorensis]